MQANRSLWPEWANFLHRCGLEKLVAAALDAAGPLNVIGAQLLYAGKPFLGQTLPEGQLIALAGLLEDSTESKSFAAYLREEVSP